MKNIDLPLDRGTRNRYNGSMKTNTMTNTNNNELKAPYLHIMCKNMDEYKVNDDVFVYLPPLYGEEDSGDLVPYGSMMVRTPSTVELDVSSYNFIIKVKLYEEYSKDEEGLHDDVKYFFSRKDFYVLSGYNRRGFERGFNIYITKYKVIRDEIVDGYAYILCDIEDYDAFSA